MSLAPAAPPGARGQESPERLPRRRTVALVGNPNTGKTTLFNALTGLSQRVGNYPGVTVERKSGVLRLGGEAVELVDLPGTYSLAARSPDELIAADVLLGGPAGSASGAGAAPVDAIVAVVDASNPDRNLFLLSQLLETGRPLVVALNMTDTARKRGIALDAAALAGRLGVPVAPLRADKGEGLGALRAALARVLAEPAAPPPPDVGFAPALTARLDRLVEFLDENRARIGRAVTRPEALRILVDREGAAETRLARVFGPNWAAPFRDLPLGEPAAHRPEKPARERPGEPAAHGPEEPARERPGEPAAHGSEEPARERPGAPFDDGRPLAALEAEARYRWSARMLAGCTTRRARPRATVSERIDALVTHRLLGSVVLVGVLALVFQAIYAGAAPAMDAIGWVFDRLGGGVSAVVPEGPLRSLLVDGVIGGTGMVVMFLPQVLVLFFFLSILEDCGYMARVAFLLDRLFAWAGLSGKAVIPLLSSFACAVPGIMAARTIEHRRDRLATIMIAPLMSCSARLPVYVLMIAAFVPDRSLLGGWVGLRGLCLLAAHFIGIAVAIPVLWLFRKTLLRGPAAPFVMELPEYRWPTWLSVLDRLQIRAREFLVRAGTVIAALAVVVWALSYFPRPASIHEEYEQRRAQVVAESADSAQRAADAGRAEAAVAALEREEAAAYLEQSVLGRVGHAIEPAVAPLGWDWRIGVAVLASFPAREVVVATLGTIFGLGGEADESSSELHEELTSARRPDGSPLFTLPVALSIVVFFALCAQCAATLAVIRRETGSWGWSATAFGYMTVLAYAGAYATHHIAVWLGA